MQSSDSVQVIPSEFTFARPYSRGSVATFEIRNNTDLPIAFKIKTTAPKTYFVKPNHGRISARSSQQVEVTQNEQVVANETASTICTDKFLIQTVSISPSVGPVSEGDIARDWDDFKAKAVHSMDIKVKCSFVASTAISSSALETSVTPILKRSIAEQPQPQPQPQLSQLTMQPQHRALPADPLVQKLQAQLDSAEAALHQRSEELTALKASSSATKKVVQGSSFNKCLFLISVVVAFLVGMLL